MASFLFFRWRHLRPTHRGNATYPRPGWSSRTQGRGAHQRSPRETAGQPAPWCLCSSHLPVSRSLGIWTLPLDAKPKTNPGQQGGKAGESQTLDGPVHDLKLTTSPLCDLRGGCPLPGPQLPHLCNGRVAGLQCKAAAELRLMVWAVFGQAPGAA